jgi:carbonic anhydrase/acetyltransferase-like protein (isoleucine patch superfamily)
MKYKLSDNKKIVLDKTLYQIIALKKFGNVKKDDLGGWVESENNLSQDGGCWVYDEAIVFGDARVYDNALVSNYAQIFGGAKVFGEASISGKALIFGDVTITGKAKVYDNAWVHGKATVTDNAKIFGNAKISDLAFISGNAKVFDDALIYGFVVIDSDNSVSGNSQLFNYHSHQTSRDGFINPAIVDECDEQYITDIELLIEIKKLRNSISKLEETFTRKTNVLAKRLKKVVAKK